VKNRLLVKNQDVAVANIPPKTSNFVPCGANVQYQGQQVKPLKHLRPARTVPQSQAQSLHKVLQIKPADMQEPPPSPQAARAAALQGRPQDIKPGVKRTVMHRASGGGGDGPHVNSKVRVIKLSGGVSRQVLCAPLQIPSQKELKMISVTTSRPFFTCWKLV
jgi:hypothetical protein